MRLRKRRRREERLMAQQFATLSASAPRAPSSALRDILRFSCTGIYPALLNGAERGYVLHLLKHLARAPRRWRGPWTEREIHLARVCRRIHGMLVGRRTWELIELAWQALGGLSSLRIEDDYQLWQARILEALRVPKEMLEGTPMFSVPVARGVRSGT